MTFPTWCARFKWYRKQQGGFWVNDHRLGWRRRPEWCIHNDLALCATNPELYGWGKDIEDYREVDQ